MPANAPLPKVEATRAYGADGPLRGRRGRRRARRRAPLRRGARRGVRAPVRRPARRSPGRAPSASSSPTRCPRPRSSWSPIGGGGLISGIATALACTRPTSASSASRRRARRRCARRSTRAALVCLDRVATMADGIAAKSPSELTLAHIRALRATTSSRSPRRTSAAPSCCSSSGPRRWSSRPARSALAALLAGKVPGTGPGRRGAVGRQRGPAAAHQAHRPRPHRRGPLPVAARRPRRPPRRARRPHRRGGRDGPQRAVGRAPPVGRRPPARRVEVLLTVETRDPEHRDEVVAALRGRGLRASLPERCSSRRPPRGTARAAGRGRRPRRGRGPGGSRPSRRPACWPRPTSTSVPTIERTICWQNALASISKRSTPSPRSIQRGVDDAAHHRASSHARRARGRTTRSRARRRTGRTPAAAPRRSSGSGTATRARRGTGRATGRLSDRVAVAAATAPSGGRRSPAAPSSASRTTISGPSIAFSDRCSRLEVEVGRRRRVEVHDLAPGVHPGVGAPAHVSSTGWREHLLERVGQRALDRAHARAARRTRGSRCRRRRPSSRTRSQRPARSRVAGRPGRSSVTRRARCAPWARCRPGGGRA